MTSTVLLFVLVAVVVAAIGLAVWLWDARRSRAVTHDPERLDPDPTTPPSPHHPHGDDRG